MRGSQKAEKLSNVIGQEKSLLKFFLIILILQHNNFKIKYFQPPVKVAPYGSLKSQKLSIDISEKNATKVIH